MTQPPPRLIGHVVLERAALREGVVATLFRTTPNPHRPICEERI
jgi:hypothetical protein